MHSVGGERLTYHARMSIGVLVHWREREGVVAHLAGQARASGEITRAVAFTATRAGSDIRDGKLFGSGHGGSAMIVGHQANGASGPVAELGALRVSTAARTARSFVEVTPVEFAAVEQGMTMTLVLG